MKVFFIDAPGGGGKFSILRTEQIRREKRGRS